MTGSNESSVLRRLAEIFRAEGDSVTADALVVQSDANANRTIGPDALAQVVALQRKGNRLDAQGAHAEGEAYLIEALRLAEQVLGPGHEDLVEHLYDLARCRFNGAAYKKAIESYQRLQRLVASVYGADHRLLSVAQYYIDLCDVCLRTRRGAQHLQAHVNRMLQLSTSERQSEPLAYEDRLREVAQRLFARGRVKTAANLLARSLILQVATSEPPEGAALDDLREYAVALWNSGHIRHAASAFQAIVAVRNRSTFAQDVDATLKRALADWSSSLEALGAHRSAQETRTLAETICANRSIE